MHETGGPVPHYVTLSGNGREVEIGAFLSEEERVELFSELQARFNDYRNRLTWKFAFDLGTLVYRLFYEYNQLLRF